MAKPRKSRRGNTLGGARQPGPYGASREFFPGRSAGELLVDDFDPEDVGFRQLVDASDVFIKRAKMPATPNSALRLDARIKEVSGLTSRGSTGSELFLELGIEELESGKFNAFIAKAVMKGVIHVRPKSRFDKLAGFAGLYSEFASNAMSSSRESAMKAFFKKHISTKDGDPSTDFTGVRAKTVLHEVHHVRHAQEQADAVIENLTEALKKEGRKKSGYEAGNRIKKSVEAHFRGWSADPKGAVHHKIVEHDCRFMIALYERNKVSVTDAAAAGNPDPENHLVQLNDVLVVLLMDLLGEPYPFDD